MPTQPTRYAPLAIAATVILASLGRSTSAAEVDALIDQALRSEAAGDNDARGQLLEQAIAINGDHGPARWNAGQLRINGEWTTVEAATESALASKTYAEYRSRRSRSEITVADQTAVARWCERNGLAGPAMAHWTQALHLDRTNRAAQRALGVSRLHGIWITKEDGKALKAELALKAKRRAVFVAEFKQLKKDLASGDERRVRNALDAVQEYTEPLDLQLLTTAFMASPPPADLAAEVSKLLVDATTTIDARWAIEFAVDLALHSQDASVRDHAFAALKYRTAVEYTPILLARLRMPTELSVQVSEDAYGNVVSYYDEYNEGPAGGGYSRSYSYTKPTYRRYRSAPVYDVQLVRPGYNIPEKVIPGRVIPERTIPASTYQCGPVTMTRRARVIPEKVIPERVIPAQRIPPQYQSTYRGTVYGGPTADSEYRAAAATRHAYQQAANKRSSVAQQDSYNAATNANIVSLLSALLDQDVPDYPRDLWTWWQQQWDANPQQREQDRLSVDLGLVHKLPTGIASGGVVQSRLGPVAIDELKVGDELLAKSPETGELAFKPVLGIGVSEGYVVPELRLDDGLLAVAPGQWIWRTGDGWRLPQDLDEGSVLHGLSGSTEVADQRNGEVDRVFTLVVADYHTLFVGADKVLIHDATVSHPSNAATPGWPPVAPVHRPAVKPENR